MKPTIELIAISISVCTFLAGIFAWYSATVVKRYAAQRDFEHLRRNYAQLAENQAAIMKEFDKRCDAIDLALIETKGLLNGLYAQVTAEISQGWRRRE